MLATSGVALLVAGAVGGAATADWWRDRQVTDAPAAVSPAPRAVASKDPAPVTTPKTDKPPEARALSNAFSATAKAVRPSVVRIDTERAAPRLSSRGAPPDLERMFERFFEFGGAPEGPAPEPGRGTGSGVIVDGAGNIVTNRHVVHGATKVTVVLHDGRDLPATVIGSDPRTDVAVVRLEKAPEGLVAARLGDSERLEVGEWVLAVGSPLGIEQTVTAGIVSGTGRAPYASHADRVRGFIQTDAKINPGNSGGPLVNLDGEVVGINTWISTGPGGAYGFAVPINDVKRVSQTILKEGRVRYAFLGVMVGDAGKIGPEDRQRFGDNLPKEGALVTQVTPGSPAAKAGLRPGDVITKIDGQPVKGSRDVVGTVSAHAIGDRISLAYVRDGKGASATATLAEAPGGDPEPSQEQGRVGLALQTLTPEIARSLGLPEGAKGVVIADVAQGSPAQQAGLQAGEVILEIDRKPIASAEEAVNALRGEKADGHLLRVRGPNGTRYVLVKAR